MHDDGEHVDAVPRHGKVRALGDTVTLGHDFRLTRRDNVPPIRIDADAEDASVVSPHLIGVEQTKPGIVRNEGVSLRIGVVGLEHVVAQPAGRV